MNPVASDVTKGKKRRRIVVALLASGVLLASWFGLRPVRVAGSKVPAPERTSAELVRQEGALWEKLGGRPFNGWLVERYPSGQLRSRSWLSNGILSGPSEGWYTNGIRQIEEHFVAGLSEGAVTRWREDGTTLSEGFARSGKLDGRFRRWHANGQLAEEITLQAGEANGFSSAWYASGSLRAEVQLDGGKIVSQRFWKDGEQPARSVAAASVP